MILPLWEFCYRSSHFLQTINELDKYFRSTVFHLCAYYLLGRYVKMSTAEPSMTDSFTYYAVSFKRYLHSSLPVDRGLLLAVDKIQRPLCAIVLILANCAYPNSGWYLSSNEGCSC